MDILRRPQEASKAREVATSRTKYHPSLKYSVNEEGAFTSPVAHILWLIMLGRCLYFIDILTSQYK
jgi:hypothetical protein